RAAPDPLGPGGREGHRGAGRQRGGLGRGSVGTRPHRAGRRLPAHGSGGRGLPAGRGGRSSRGEKVRSTGRLQPRAPDVGARGEGLTLSGRTVDEGGRPVAGALVTLGTGPADFMTERDQATADGTGRFAFRNLSPGKAQLVVRRSGFAARRVTDVEIPAERSA